MQNVDFLKFFRTSLLWSKKHSFLYRISKNVFFSIFWLKKKKVWEKGRFLDKNHGVTLLHNVVFFFDFVRTSFLRSKKLYFLSRISKNVSLLLFAQKKFIRKRSIFWQKPWTNPFEKCPFFSTMLEFHLSGFKSILLYPEDQKIFLSGFFCSKGQMRERSIFWEKPWTNLFAKLFF